MTLVQADAVTIGDFLECRPTRRHEVVDWKPGPPGEATGRESITFVVRVFDGYDEFTFWRDESVAVMDPRP